MYMDHNPETFFYHEWKSDIYIRVLLHKHNFNKII